MDDLEELQKRLDEEKAKAYAQAQAEAETKELATIMQDTNKTLKVKLNQTIVNEIERSPEVQDGLKNDAHTLIGMGVQTQKNEVEAELKKSQKDRAKAEFELNKDQYMAFGQDTSPDEPWKKKLIKYGYNFWFVIISVICFMSLAPFYIFMKVIKTQVGILKFVSIAIGVILLLICMGGLTYALLGWTGII